VLKRRRFGLYNLQHLFQRKPRHDFLDL
jgi:hypothetical protein